MKLKTIILILSSGLLFAACGKKDGKDNGHVPDTVTQQSETVASFKYYKGGFYPPPNSPNWSNDMIITFTTTGFSIEGRHPDALCGRSGPYTEAQAKVLFDLVSALIVSVKAPGGPQTADAGVEYIEITSSQGVVKKYHLMNMEVPVGEMFAVNPQNIRTYLQDLEAGLATFCQ